MGRKQRFDTEFKRNAVNLVLEERVNQRRISEDLGIGLSTLQKWIRDSKAHGETAFPGSGNSRPEDERYRKLERENEILKRERDILEKALAIFSSP